MPGWGDWGVGLAGETSCAWLGRLALTGWGDWVVGLVGETSCAWLGRLAAC